MQRGGRLSCIQNSTPLQTAKMALVPSYFVLGPYYLCVYLCVFNVYMCVCVVYVTCVQVLVKARRGCQILPNWSPRSL